MFSLKNVKKSPLWFNSDTFILEGHVKYAKLLEFKFLITYLMWHASKITSIFFVVLNVNK